MADPTNAQIAAALDELGDLYELDGAVSYRVIAYRNAAKAVRESSVSIIAMTREGRVTSVPGIGKTLEEKLRALDATGDIPALVKLRAKFPAGLVAVMHLPGFGAKRARKLFDELGIDSLDALRAAVEAGKIRELRGFGLKAEETLKQTLAEHDAAGGASAPRVVLSRAEAVAEEVVAALRAHPASDRVEVAGSLRRRADSVKDLDIIATASDPKALAGTLGDLELVESVQSSGEAGARVTTHTGMKIDLKVVAPDQFGNVLQHFTGSKAHNVALREAAVRRGLHVSEYGILDDETGETLRCATEEEVYERLGLPWIPPELREGRGELEAARGDDGLPELVTLEDLKGDMHMHTTASDGLQTAEEMALAARERGLEYVAITDHSASHGFGNDISPAELERRIDLVHALNEQIDGIEVLIGTESNILTDGSLDYPDELLERLDWVIASIHTSFRMRSKEMTDRMVAAIEHPLVDAIGHPTGRKIERRQPYALDLGRVIEAAARTGTMLEINAAPDRRDLDEIHAREAARAGVPILIDSDAHSTRNLRLLAYGVDTARRAWLTPEQVANTRPWAEFRKLRKRARSRAN
jgi:DNA polymerase (family X)